MFLRKSTRELDKFIVHHFGGVPPEGTNVESIRVMHTTPKANGGRGWADIGYHGLIHPDGSFEVGRDVDIDGAHAFGSNRNSLGIMLVAGLAEGDTHTRPTPAQLATLIKLIAEQRAHFPEMEIMGHRDTKATLCPGFDVRHWLITGKVQA